MNMNIAILYFKNSTRGKAKGSVKVQVSI